MRSFQRIVSNSQRYFSVGDSAISTNDCLSRIVRLSALSSPIRTNLISRRCAGYGRSAAFLEARKTALASRFIVPLSKAIFSCVSADIYTECLRTTNMHPLCERRKLLCMPRRATKHSGMTLEVGGLLFPNGQCHCEDVFAGLRDEPTIRIMLHNSSKITQERGAD